LINPNGIIFGANARLDIRGSFVATTANAIRFGDRGEFSATNSTNPGLLTVNPSALLFNQIRAASIQNNSVADAGLNPSAQFTATGLRVPDGKSLLLVGGDINMNSGGLFAFGGRVELGGLASAGTVGLNVDGNNLSSSFPNNAERSDVFLNNGASVTVIAGDGGSIAVNARNLVMTGESFLFAGIESGLGSDNSQAGNIDINVTKAITLNNGSRIANQVESETRGQGGDINISTTTLRLEGGSQINAVTLSAGKGGNVTANASQEVLLTGTSTVPPSSSGLFTSALQNSTGDAGNVTINTKSFQVRDGAQASVATFGKGKGGNVTVNASQEVLLTGRSANGLPSGLFASTERNSRGDAGNLIVNTNKLSVQNGATVGVQSFGTGIAGNVTLNALFIQLNNNGLIFTNATGENVIGGNINIDTDFLFALENSDISANSANFRGGNVRINASGIFGTQFREMPDDRTSDITATGASPQLSGSVELDIPNIDPNSGLVNLPSVPVDTQVAQTCTPSSGQNQSEFIVTGRGGLPPNPTQVLSSDATAIDWVALPPTRENQSSPTPATNSTAPLPAPIVEATGWEFDRQGKVILTASNVPAQPHNSWQSSAGCKL